MNIFHISKDHQWSKYPAFYNVYPIFNEIHPTITTGESKRKIETSQFIDSLYGRVYDAFSINSKGIYGRSSHMNYYSKPIDLPVVDEFRVPFRKIPVYEATCVDQIKNAISKIQGENTGYEILLRGQTKPYFIERTKEELELFYGCEKVKEPSFLPSHLRHDFDEVFLQSMWHNQTAMLFNDIGFYFSTSLPKKEFELYVKDTNYIKNTHLMTAFSLGIAQHYGMPSVGLDLTDDLEVANWFSSNSMKILENGSTITEKVDSSKHKTSMVYIFRCPKDTVFDYKVVKPKVFPNSRPDAQSAWFSHVGWGAASNQLGSYLVCAFRLTEAYLDSLPEELEYELFPKIEDDPILDFFMNKKNTEHYEGNAKKALKNVYFLE
jgi:hypothetical protein